MIVAARDAGEVPRHKVRAAQAAIEGRARKRLEGFSAAGFQRLFFAMAYIIGEFTTVKKYCNQAAMPQSRACSGLFIAGRPALQLGSSLHCWQNRVPSPPARHRVGHRNGLAGNPYADVAHESACKSGLLRARLMVASVGCDFSPTKWSSQLLVRVTSRDHATESRELDGGHVGPGHLDRETRCPVLLRSGSRVSRSPLLANLDDRATQPIPELVCHC